MIERSIQVGWRLRVFFSENIFAPENPLLRDALADVKPRKVLVVLEDSLSLALPELEHRIQNYFAAHAAALRLVRPPLYVCGGESAKNSTTLVGELHANIHRHHIDRHSYLIAVGGGALLDVAGFASATAHRGLRLVRVPTTTLSQANSGVGVKNGLNAFGQKNFIGTFTPPFAVFNDFTLLATLLPQDKRNGYVEAVKIACLRDAAFFEELERNAAALAAFAPELMKHLVHRCAELHLDHLATGGDPFERTSARPLDFGHWAAHKVEQLSRFEISHGDAVAIGIAIDVIYSRNAGLLDAPSTARILDLLEKLGFKLFTAELLNTNAGGQLQILGGLEEFREHLGGELSVTLLPEIGRSIQVHEMDPQIIVGAINELHGRRK